MSKRRLTVASMILMIHNVVLFLWGLFWIILPERIISVSFQSFLGRGWDDFITSNADIARFIDYHGQLLGIQFVILSIVITAITLTAYKKGEKWSWIVIAICSTIGWICAAAFDVIMGVMPALLLEIIPLIVVFCSLIISAKPAFSHVKK